ncbi:COesterase domain-containing protein [Trichonephila clavipes]|uniref:COesterase domain-containing protein n=1 Tax=Trichonephila clavipes TaxID=2585209 RepID=A0A8X6STU0_TRICX|nr:COesterase domain-containing protein [Trichonephila clavipes]
MAPPVEHHRKDDRLSLLTNLHRSYGQTDNGIQPYGQEAASVQQQFSHQQHLRNTNFSQLEPEKIFCLRQQFLMAAAIIVVASLVVFVLFVTTFRTPTACSDVVQSGRPIFDDFFQHLWPYIGNNTAEFCLPNGQAFVAYPHRPMTLHSPTENSLAVLNHKILEANSQVQNVKLGGHLTCLSINRLWHKLCDMLRRRLVGTIAPGHHDCSIQE